MYLDVPPVDNTYYTITFFIISSFERRFRFTQSFLVPVLLFAMSRSTFRSNMESYFWRYGSSLKVPMSLFRNNRERLVSRLRAKSEVRATGTFVVLQGGVDVPFNDTDINWPFRQVRTGMPMYPLAFAGSIRVQ